MTSDYAKAVEAAPGHVLPRKWISARLEQLDVETDYSEIVRLSSLYHLNDLQLDWFYTVGTPAAGINPAVNDAVVRNQSGKFVTQATKRRDDSVDHMITWLEHGPDAFATRRSVEMVNAYHKHYSNEYPMGFDDVEDYIYILCLNATLVNFAQKLVGEPGLDKKQQHAIHRVWSGVADSFTMPDGRSVTEVVPFPASYDGMEQCVRSYQQRSWPVHEPSRISTTAGIERFARTYFPAPLHFLGRAIVTAFMPEELLRAHAIKRPAPFSAWLARKTMKTMMVVSRLSPDPRENLQDQRRRLAADGKSARSIVDIAVHRRAGVTANTSHSPASLCPHMAAVADSATVSGS